MEKILFIQMTIKQLTNCIVFLTTFLLSITCFSQNYNKNQLSLNGQWDIIFDDNNEGVQKKWYLEENYNKNVNKKLIKVPSSWEEFEKDYEGVAIYRTKFKIPENWDKKIIELNFEAVNYKSEVWLNDQVVGFHEGGYSPFKFRIDNLAKLGKENTLIVRVISPIILTDKYIDGLGRQEMPMWRGAITGGIWQSVSVSAKGSIGLNDVFIEPKITTNTATFNIEINNTNTYIDKAELSISILSKDGAELIRKSDSFNVLPGKNKVQWHMPIKNAEYWSIENPYLYNAQVLIKTNESISDKFETKFGLREFTIKNNEFYLNDKPLYLKATFFEGLYPVRLAYPDSKEMAVKEIKLAKEAGFNMIRPWRKPASKMWLDLCDEMGVLTVGSLAVECMKRPISTPRLSFVVENELRQTIMSNRNRTSIVQWELFNEINRPILAQMLNSMSVLARELDPTRMILDESGGWGEGANIYLPYEKTPTKFNDIHHYSGSQVDEKEFNGYLATGKTNDELKTLSLENTKGYGKNVVPGIMTFISEIGYGSTPNLTSNNKVFNEIGNPLLATTIYHKELDEGYKKALKKVGFNKIYKKTEDLYIEQQKMHGIANKRMLEATRLNETIMGYCVHALVGGDWVLGAGLLDLWRNPKTLAYEMTKEANQKQIIPIRILPRNVYAQKGTQLEIHGVNELANEKTKLSVRIVSENGETVFEKSIKQTFKRGVSKLFSTKINTQNFNGNYTVKVELKNENGKIISNNNESFDVFNKESLLYLKNKIAIIDPEKSLTNFLEQQNIEYVSFTKELNLDIPVFIGKSIKKSDKYKEQVEMAKSHVKAGGYAVILDVPGKNAENWNRELKEISKEVLPFGVELLGKWDSRGGWAAKSHIVTEHPIFNGLPTNQIMHGVYENVHPITSMSKQEGLYIAGMIGYDHFPNKDIMVRNYNGIGEVWWSADVLEANLGKGKMLLSTFQIIENLGKDPVADKLLLNMINFSTKN